jgi:hypothetical protein
VRSLLRLFIIILGMVLLIPFSSVNAQDEPQEPSVGNDTCLQCHSDPNLTMPLGDGSQLSLYIDQNTFDNSIHGSEGYACVQCHRNLGDYPHPSFSAENKRDLALQLYTSCQICHSGEYAKTLDSVHQRAREAGNIDAAICTDCHGAHNIRQLTDPETGNLLPEARIHIPQTCAQCHSAIYAEYKDSVHGSALISQGNLDVPTCIDCHGVHNIEDPTTAAFRLNSPLICAGCHTDPQRMAKYGISTDVLNTYVADFHGTTVTIFEKLSPDAETNKPVCFDCHGIHDIKSINDPSEGLLIQENLLKRCQVCHPQATINFPKAWLSHYIPSPDNNSLVYYVNLFYKFFIPGTLGGMAILVVLDFSSRLRARGGQKQDDHPEIDEHPEGQEAPPPDVSPQLRLVESKDTVAEPQDTIQADDADQQPNNEADTSPSNGDEEMLGGENSDE